MRHPVIEEFKKCIRGILAIPRIDEKKKKKN
jgi:hypothetical protein